MPIPHTQINSISITHMITKSNCSLHWNQVNADSPHWNQVHFDHPHNNQINFITKLKSSQVLSPTLKSSPFRLLTQKTSPFRLLTQKQVHSDANSQNKLCPARIQKPSQFRPPAQRLSQSILTLKQVIFGLHTKTRSISIPTLKTKSISIHTFKSCNVRPAQKKRSRLWPPHKTSQFRSRP